MYPTVSYGCRLSLTVSPRAMELLHVFYCLLLLLAVSYRLSGRMDLLHVSYCHQCLLAVSYCLSGPM